MHLKYAIAFSGGYDSSYFLKQICQNRESYKYLLINFYTHTKSKYNNNHFVIAETLYNWGLKYLIIKNKTQKNSKNKNRIQRLSSIYQAAIDNKIKTIYFLSSHTDIIETFLIRVFKSTKTYGLTTIHNKSYQLFYKGHALQIITPQTELTRSSIIDSTTRICADYSNEKNANLRNKIRQHINIGKKYYDVIRFLELTTFLEAINKYEYLEQFLMLSTTTEGYCEKQLINALCKGTNILHYQANNTINKSKINIYKNQDVNKCHVQIINQTMFIKLSFYKIEILQKKNKVIIIANSLHKIIICGIKDEKVSIEQHKDKKYQNTNSCFQRTFKIIIQSQGKYKIVIKYSDIYKEKYIAIENHENLHIYQTIAQKIVYK